MYWKAKIYIQNWSLVVEDLRKSCEVGPKIDNFVSLNRKKRYFKSWRKATNFLKKVTTKTKKMREIALACSLVNTTWYRMIARKMIHSWRRDGILLNQEQQMKRLSENICLKYHLICWYQIVRSKDEMRTELNDERV